MCNKACIEFGKSLLREDEICGKSVIEVGFLTLTGRCGLSLSRCSRVRILAWICRWAPAWI